MSCFNNKNEHTTLGILGGLGPMSSVYFYELITKHTDASCDQEHINIILSSRVTTPDRTAYIIGESGENPLPIMEKEAHRLAAAGATLIAMPCNTAHFFYEALNVSSSVPILNIIDLTVKFAKYAEACRVGLLSTAGTAKCGAYSAACTGLGLECVVCDEREQSILNDIIYNSVKRGLPPDMAAFSEAANHLTMRGCHHLILGCTELSLIKKESRLTELPKVHFIDSLEVLAACTISACGKRTRGFSRELEEFAAMQSVWREVVICR